MLLELSDREKEVLHLFDQGFTYKEIATRLEISEHTVRTYCQRIILKTYCNSMRVAAFVRRCQAQGAPEVKLQMIAAVERACLPCKLK